MAGSTKLLTSSGGGVILTPASSIASDVTVNIPPVNGTLVNTGSLAQVSQAMLATSVIPIGVGQTWQNLTSSRTLAGSYTNSTGRPIYISVTCTNAGSSGATGFVLTVSGVSVGSTYIIQQTGAGNYNTNLSAVVPDGATYNLSGGVSVTLQNWSELR